MGEGSTPSSTRRQYLRATGGAIASLAAVSASPARGAMFTDATRSTSPIAFHLGMASYTLRKFDLRSRACDDASGGVRSNLPQVDASSAPRQAGRDRGGGSEGQGDRASTLYGGGVISMKTERDVTQAFEYAKTAGLQTITAAPVPEVLPMLEQHVKKYDILVAIHNHGPGDRRFPTPQSAYDAVK